MPKWHILGWSVLIPFKAMEQGGDRSSLHIGVAWLLAQYLLTALFPCSAWAFQEQTHAPHPRFQDLLQHHLAQHFLGHGASRRRGCQALAHRVPESVLFGSFPILQITAKPRRWQLGAWVSFKVLLFDPTTVDYASSVTRVFTLLFLNIYALIHLRLHWLLFAAHRLSLVGVAGLLSSVA